MPRRRKTIAELKEAGTYRPSRHGARASAEAGAAPVVPLVAPSEPSSDVAVERAAIAALLGSRVTIADGPMLDDLAERVVEVRRLRDAQRALPPGSVEYGRVARVLANSRAALDRLAREFGLTPGSRTSLPVTENPNGALTWH